MRRREEVNVMKRTFIFSQQKQMRAMDKVECEKRMDVRTNEQANANARTNDKKIHHTVQ